MSVDVVLINSSGIHGIYGSLATSSLVSREPPLWVRIVGGYLLDRGYSVAAIDQEAEELTPAQVAERVAFYAPRLVVIVAAGHQPSASTQAMPGARAVAEAVLAHAAISSAPFSRVKIALMGNHASALPERTLLEEPVNYVIDGEGPATVAGLLDLLAGRPGTIADIPGLVYRKYEECEDDSRAMELKVARNPPAPLLHPDRDLSGRRGWDLLPPPSAYLAHNWQCLDTPKRRTPYASIHTTLGCPFRCHFCMINVFQHGNQYRRRDPKQVFDEMLWLYERHGVKTFKIIDELFVLDKGHYTALCTLLANSGVAHELNIWAYARTDTVNADTLPLLRAAGVRWLALGIESADPEVQSLAQKTQRVNPHRVVAQIRAADINTIGNYIFGLEGDTRATMQATLDLALSLQTEWANFYVALPYPGSGLYEDVARERPQDLPPSWEAYSQHNPHTYPLRTETLAPSEILAFRDQAFTRYFSDPAWRDRLFWRFGPRALAHVDEMLQYPLVRNILK